MITISIQKQLNDKKKKYSKPILGDVSQLFNKKLGLLRYGTRLLHGQRYPNQKRKRLSSANTAEQFSKPDKVLVVILADHIPGGH